MVKTGVYMKKLGLGTQEFLNFKKENLIYVDKTEVINKLINEGRHYFLSRPSILSAKFLTVFWQL